MNRDKGPIHIVPIRVAALRVCVSGLAAIEFAMLAPFFLLLLVGMIDLGGFIYTSNRLETAVAAGAQYAANNAASVNATNGATLARSVATVVESEVNSAWANDTIDVNNGPTESARNGTLTTGDLSSGLNANNCWCPTGSPPNWSWGSSATCGSSCPSGGVAGKFVSITASVTYTPLLAAFGLIRNNTLTQNAMIQVQ